jgi:hypothetical protein
MDWKHYPPLFTAAMETVADLANTKLQAKVSRQAHHLDAVSESPIELEIPLPVNLYGPAPLHLPSTVIPMHTCSRPVKA